MRAIYIRSSVLTATAVAALALSPPAATADECKELCDSARGHVSAGELETALSDLSKADSACQGRFAVPRLKLKREIDLRRQATTTRPKTRSRPNRPSNRSPVEPGGRAKAPAPRAIPPAIQSRYRALDGAARARLFELACVVVDDGTSLLEDDAEIYGLWSLVYLPLLKPLNSLVTYVGASQVAVPEDPEWEAHPRLVAQLLTSLMGSAVFTSEAPFLHVHPDLPAWIVSNLLPLSPQEPLCGDETAGQMYARFARHAARTFAHAYVSVGESGVRGALASTAMKEDYLAHATTNWTRADSEDSRWRVEGNKMPESLCDSRVEPWCGPTFQYDQAYHFWIRREIDGSAENFGSLLAWVLKTYDAGFYTSVARGLPPPFKVRRPNEP